MHFPSHAFDKIVYNMILYDMYRKNDFTEISKNLGTESENNFIESSN